MSTERLFLAAPLSDAAREELQQRLRAAERAGAPLPGRTVPARNWHVTLRFLGDTAAAQRDAFLRALRTAELPAPFRLRLGGFGAFGSARRAAVLWLGVEDGAEPLGRLAAAAEEAARQAGFAPEQRPFSPHLTLARLRPPADVHELIERLPAVRVETDVDHAVLYRSRTGGGAPVYEPVERIDL